MQLLIEALTVGVVFMLLLVIMSYLIYNTELSDKKLLILGFLTGSIAHLGFEAANMNKWYCTNGNACLKK